MTSLMVLPASQPFSITESSIPISASSQLSPIRTSSPRTVSLPSSSHSTKCFPSFFTSALPPQGLLEAIEMNFKGYNFFSIIKNLTHKDNYFQYRFYGIGIDIFAPGPDFGFPRRVCKTMGNRHSQTRKLQG